MDPRLTAYPIQNEHGISNGHSGPQYSHQAPQAEKMVTSTESAVLLIDSTMNTQVRVWLLFAAAKSNNSSNSR